MKNSTLLHDLTPDELTAMFQGIKAQLNELQEKFEPRIPAEYLTRSEVAKLLKCDLSTIHNWTKKGKLISYAIGNRVYYKRDEVEATLLQIR